LSGSFLSEAFVDRFPDANQELLSPWVINQATNFANRYAFIPEVDQIKREDPLEVPIDILWQICSSPD